MSASDAEWNATLHVLAAPALADKKAWLGRHIHFMRREIDWAEILDESGPWSHGQQILVLAAFALWGGGRRAGGMFDLTDAVTTLDAINLRWLLEGIMLYRPDVQAPRTPAQLLGAKRP